MPPDKDETQNVERNRIQQRPRAVVSTWSATLLSLLLPSPVDIVRDEATQWRPNRSPNLIHAVDVASPDGHLADGYEVCFRSAR